MSTEEAKTVLIAAIISVVIRGDDGAPITGLGARGDVDDLLGEEDRVLADVADSGSLFPITERIAYDRGAGNGIVEARTPVAGAGFSISGPKSNANAGVSGVVAYLSATDLMWIRRHDRRAAKAVGRIPKPCSALGIDRPAMLGRKTAKPPAACKRSETSPATRACSIHPGGRTGRQGCRYMADTTPRRRRLSRFPCQYSSKPVTSPPQYSPPASAMTIRPPVPRHLSREWLRQKRRRQIILDRFKIEFLRKLCGEVTADNTVATVSFPVSLASGPIKNGERLLAEDQDPLAGVIPQHPIRKQWKRKNSATLRPSLRPSRISIFKVVALTRFTKYGDACCRCNETRPLPSSATTALQYRAVPTLCA